MRIYSPDKVDEIKNNYPLFYVLAIFTGVIVAYVLLVMFGLVKIVALLLIKYWLYALGGIAGLLILRKLLFRSKKK